MITSHARTRVTAALLTAGALLTAAGCASTPEADDSDLSFSFSYPATDNSPYVNAVQLYMDQHPGVTVTLNAIPAENYDDVLRTQLQAGNASDLIMATPGSGSAVALLSLAQADLITPLDADTAVALSESTAHLFERDGNRFGQPTDISITGTIFNSSAGVEYPSDTAALMSTCTSLDEGTSFFALAGAIPINTGLAALSMAATNVYAQNPDWDEERAAGTTTFASTPGWRDTLQLVLDLQEQGCFQPGAEGSGFDAIINGFGQGTALTAFIPGGAATDLAPAANGQKLVVESFPAPRGGTPFIFASSDYALAISKNADHQAGAQQFLEWFAQPENAQAYATAAGTIPVTGIDGVDLSDTVYAPVADLIADGAYVPFPATVWTSPAVFDTLGSGVQALLTGQQDVDGLLADLDAAWDAS